MCYLKRVERVVLIFFFQLSFPLSLIAAEASKRQLFLIKVAWKFIETDSS